MTKEVAVLVQQVQDNISSRGCYAPLLRGGTHFKWLQVSHRGLEIHQCELSHKVVEIQIRKVGQLSPEFRLI